MSSGATIAFNIALIVVGATAVLGNALVIVTILSAKALRRQFVLVCALSCADSVCGLRFVVYSSITVARDGVSEFSAACPISFSLAHPRVLWLFSYFVIQLSPILCIFIAVDRLACVYRLDAYRGYNARAIHLGVIGASCVVALLSATGMLIGTDSQVVVDKCSQLLEPSAVPENNTSVSQLTAYVVYHYSLIIALGSTAFVLYIFIFVGLHRHYRSLSTASIVVANYGRQQHRLTMTLGLIMVCNVLFSVVPYTGSLVMLKTHSMFEAELLPLQYVGTLLFALNYVADLVVYSVYNRQIREGMMRFVSCRYWSSTGDHRKLPAVRVLYAHYRSRSRCASASAATAGANLERPGDAGAVSENFSTSVCDVILSRGYRRENARDD